MNTTADPIRLVLDALGENVRTTGAGKWEARCPVPAHDDRHASLSISAGDDGCVLLKCHRGCSVGEICGAIGLTLKDLFVPKNGHPKMNGKKTETPKPRKTHATWDGLIAAAEWATKQERGAQYKFKKSWKYERLAADGTAEEFGHIIRLEIPGDKRVWPATRVEGGFQLRDPDGKWPPLYEPDLAEGGQILVNEGEGKADICRAMGFTATCSAHGADSANSTDWRILAGQEVPVILDNDDAGEKYGATVAAILTGLTPPARVKLIRLPGLPKGGDVKEWMQAGGTADQLQAIIDAAPYWTPEPGQNQRSEPTKTASTNTAVFPDPIPLDSPRPPELPSGIFRYVLGDMVHAVAEATEAPPELPLAFGLATIATVGQKRFSVMVKPGYFEPVNIWTLCALASGNRKSECMRYMLSPLSEWEERQAAELIPAIEKAASERKTIEARITRLRTEAAKAKSEDFARLTEEVADMEATLPEVPRVPQLFTQDVTPEHLGTMLSDNGERLSLLSDEGGLFDIMGGRYSDGLPNLDVYLQAHAGSPVRVNRGSRPAVNLRHPALTIGASPQPDVLRGLTAKKALRGRGLLARFLYLLPASPLGFRTNHNQPVPDSVARSWRDCVHSIADVKPDTKDDRDVPHVLFITDETRERWDAFWTETEPMMRPGGRLESVTDWAGKLPGAVARIAGLIHCADYASSISTVRNIEPGTMERAIQFGRFLIEHALIAFDTMGADPAREAARDLWRVIEKQRQPIVTLRDAWNPLRGSYKTVADAEPGFDILIDHGYLIEPHQADDSAPRKRGRPPSRQFNVNPKLMGGWQ